MALYQTVSNNIVCVCDYMLFFSVQVLVIQSLQTSWLPGWKYTFFFVHKVVTDPDLDPGFGGIDLHISDTQCVFTPAGRCIYVKTLCHYK